MLKPVLTSIGLCTLLTAGRCGASDGGMLVMQGEYLGLTPPGLTPELFAPGAVSSPANELNLAMSPDGTELYFAVGTGRKNTLMVMTQTDGVWSEREVAPFSGNFSDVDPYFAPDGRRLFFSSTRPVPGSNEVGDSDLWYMEKRTDGSWGLPVRLEQPNSTEYDDYYTSIANDNSLYFSVFGRSGRGGDIYRTEFRAGAYTAPELLGEPISTSATEHDPFIAPDQSYLIFASDRAGGLGRTDLYISFRSSDGSWRQPINMGDEINSEGFDFTPMLSPDGKYLFFTRSINSNGDIFWVSSAIIQQLNPAGGR